MNNFDSMMMGDMGSLPHGEYFNKFSGDRVFVKDCIIDGDNMLLMTDKGQITMNEFSDTYIQMGDVTENFIPPKQQTSSFVGDMNEQDLSILKNINNPNKPTPPQKNIVKSTEQPKINNEHNQESTADIVVKEKQITNSSYMISKIIDKTIEDGNKPKVNIDIDWTNFPTSEIKMLVDYFDVSIDDISNYLYNNIFNEEYIKKNISEFLSTKI